MNQDSSELLGFIRQIAGDLRRIADHFTKDTNQAVPGVSKELTFYGQGRPETTHDEISRPARRPRQGSRS